MQVESDFAALETELELGSRMDSVPQAVFDALRLGSQAVPSFPEVVKRLLVRVVGAVVLEDIRGGRYGSLVSSVFARLLMSDIPLARTLIKYRSPAAVAITRGTPAANACLAALLASLGSGPAGVVSFLLAPMLLRCSTDAEVPPLPRALACLDVLDGQAGTQPNGNVRCQLLDRLRTKSVRDAIPDLAGLVRAQPLEFLMSPDSGYRIFDRMLTSEPSVALVMLQMGFSPHHHRPGLADLVVWLLLGLDAGSHQAALEAVGLHAEGALHACRAPSPRMSTFSAP